MFKGFMDEGSSEDAQSEAFVVAGFAGAGLVCDSVEDAWRETVKPIGELHCLEFFKRHDDGSMAGIYTHVSVDAESCVMRLIDLLAASKLEPIGMAIDAKCFLSLSDDERRWMTSAVPYGKSWPMEGSRSDPYFTGFHYCITVANEITPEGEIIYLTFDRHASREGNARKIYNELKDLGGKWGGRLVEAISFSSRHEAVLLQAADLLAYSIAQALKPEGRRHKVIEYALRKLAFKRNCVRVMDTNSIDRHLQKCPFRRTFWKGLSDWDFFEQVRVQGMEVLAIKHPDGLYLTHHIKREKVRVIQEIDAVPVSNLDLGALNRTDRLDDSTKNNRESGENSVDS